MKHISFTNTVYKHEDRQKASLEELKNPREKAIEFAESKGIEVISVTEVMDPFLTVTIYYKDRK